MVIWMEEFNSQSFWKFNFSWIVPKKFVFGNNTIHSNDHNSHVFVQIEEVQRLLKAYPQVPSDYMSFVTCPETP